MEFVTGVKEKEAMELPEVIVQEEGTEVIRRRCNSQHPKYG